MCDALRTSESCRYMHESLEYTIEFENCKRMYWILGNENIDLSILGITIPRLPVSSTVWQGDSSPMKLSYLTDRFVKRGKMDGHCPNPLSLAGLDQ